MLDSTDGFTPIEGPSAWYGPDMAKRSNEWLYRLDDADVAEVNDAVATLTESGTAILEVNRENFPLPNLGPVLDGIQDDVVNGRGFVLIRGLPVDTYTIEQAALAYFGIGAYFGWAIPQNAKGHVLGHVRDIGLDPDNPEHRLYGTRARHLYHTDSCDIVGLLCLQTAKSGGQSKIASSVTVYNEMLKRRPDLVAVMAQPFCLDRKGEIPEGKGPYYQMPVFNPYGGYLTTTYNRDFITAAQRFDDVPRLTGEQIEAMDLADEIAGSDEVRLDMDFRPGDIQFIHNHQMLHSRTPYEDYPEPERKRHLLRLWLAPPNSRPLAPVIAERFGSIEQGTARGGIRVPGQILTAPLQPE
ncbi:MAG: TauD/TfdA family dioxygenase [Acidimicrobiia bacterium]|nr:MAG: TauD/TfdA family dioxygenase [Acidimicrobiia bacterium]